MEDRKTTSKFREMINKLNNSFLRRKEKLKNIKTITSTLNIVNCDKSQKALIQSKEVIESNIHLKNDNNLSRNNNFHIEDVAENINADMLNQRNFDNKNIITLDISNNDNLIEISEHKEGLKSGITIKENNRISNQDIYHQVNNKSINDVEYTISEKEIKTWNVILI